ncbi:L,D-transpeptidase family protein [uncultured Thioclava sp.]|uniref:L,D-transpeptidase family protein n=1 Tax=uncultured Thioclava sp. TaxID=473858 RepID=UPI0025F4D410|nr:L,D-transpeptidase family protein [uncultured Thioclava sp.]
MRLTPSGLLFRGRRFPVQIGRGGITMDKHEGDGATPVGKLQILRILYRADRLPAPQDWAEPIGPRDLWCDASGHPDYNHDVRAPFAASHETLRRADPLYDIVLVTDWNYPNARPGKGSAIFLHQRRRAGYPTEGCLAFRRDHLIWIAQRVTPGEALDIPIHLARNTPSSGA